tara:strand:- start:763 stop:2469 length:1707 start_codon:yes stop_codon:yes gene_type:complete
MWQSETLLNTLKYRETKKSLIFVDDGLSGEQLQQKKIQIEEMERKAALVSDDDIVEFLKEIKLKYLGYQNLILPQVMKIYPILVDYMNSLIYTVLESIDDALKIREEYPHDRERFFTSLVYIFTKETTIRKSPDKKIGIIQLSLCIIILDFLITNDELLVNEISDKNFYKLRKIRQNWENETIYEPDKEYDSKKVEETKLRAYSSYLEEKNNILASFKQKLRKSIDSVEELIDAIKHMKYLGQNFIDTRSENDSYLFGREEFDKLKKDSGIDFAKQRINDLMEYDASGENNSHLGMLHEALLGVERNIENDTTIGSTETLGLIWVNIGDTKPNKGTELVNQYLNDAIYNQLQLKDSENVVFTERDWKEIGIKDLRMDHYIDVEGIYYTPSRKKIVLREVQTMIKDNKQSLDKTMELGRISKYKKYTGIFLPLSQFIIKMEILVQKFIKVQPEIYSDILSVITKQAILFNEKLHTCWGNRIESKEEAHFCLQKLEHILGIKLDKNVVLYPLCELKACNYKNKRGKCYNGKRLVKCKKNISPIYSDIISSSPIESSHPQIDESTPLLSSY